MALYGIDVSSYQGTIDWEKVKANGVGFAIIKVIRKDLNPDKQYLANMNGCRANGIYIAGVYNYSYATTISKFKSDAKRVLETLNGNKVTVWLDIEDKCQRGLGSVLIDGILAYKEVIESAGLYFGVYTGLSFYNSYMKKYAERLKDVQFWIARYPSSVGMTIYEVPQQSKKPRISNAMVGWQYSSKGKISGISGNVDMNEWYDNIDSAEFDIYYPKYNGYSISIAKALESLGVDGTYAHRKKIACANGIVGYKGSASQNTKLLSLLKNGKLMRE